MKRISKIQNTKNGRNKIIVYRNYATNSAIPMAKVARVVVQTSFGYKGSVCEYELRWLQLCAIDELVNHVANLMEYGR